MRKDALELMAQNGRNGQRAISVFAIVLRHLADMEGMELIWNFAFSPRGDKILMYYGSSWRKSNFQRM